MLMLIILRNAIKSIKCLKCINLLYIMLLISLLILLPARHHCWDIVFYALMLKLGHKCTLIVQAGCMPVKPVLSQDDIKVGHCYY
jgi:hypothetical protein